MRPLQHLSSYRYAGFNLWSDLALPLPPGSAAAAIDCRLEHASEVKLTAPQFELAAGIGNRRQLLLNLPGLDQCLIEASGKVSYTTMRDPHSVPLKFILLDFICGVLRLQGGTLVLNATVVNFGAQNLMICGADGVGKSSLAALYSRCGGTIVCDGAVPVHFDRYGAAVHGSARYLRLRPAALSYLGVDSCWRFSDHYFLPLAFQPAHDCRLQIDQIVCLAPGSPAAVRPTVQTADLAALLSAVWFYTLAARTLAGDLLVQLRAFAEHLPLTVIRDPDFERRMTQGCAWLERRLPGRDPSFGTLGAA